MKPRTHCIFRLSSIAAFGMISHSGAQTTFTKADNTTTLNLAGSYVTSGGPPGVNDSILIDNTLTMGRTSALGDNLSIKGITMDAASGRQLQIGNTAGKVLTIGSDGVTKNANTSPLIFANAVTLGANQTWALATSSSGNLQMNGLFSDGGHTLAVTGAGIFDLRGSNTFGANVTIDAPVSVNSQNAVVTFGGVNTFDVLRIPAGRVIGATIGNFGVASSFGDGGTGTAIILGFQTTFGVMEYSGLSASSNRTVSRDARTTGSGIDVTQAGQTLTFTGGTWTGSGTNGITDGIGNGWAFGGAGNLSINAILADTATVSTSLTKKDSGTLTLSGNNLYAGATIINGGMLQSTRNAALNTTSSVAVNNTGTLAVNYGGASDYSAAEVVTLLGKTTFGATDTALGFDTGNATGAVTYGNALTMAAGLTKLGTGTLILDQINTYTGTSSIRAGTLKLSGSGTLGAATSTLGVIASGAVLDLNGTHQVVSGFSGVSGGQIQNNSGSGTSILTLAGGVASAFGGVIADNNATDVGGKVGLALSGAGAVTLSGANTFSGGFTLNSGAVVTIGVAAVISAGNTVSSALGSYDGSQFLTINGGRINSGNLAFHARDAKIGGDFTFATTSRTEFGGSYDLQNGTRTMTLTRGANAANTVNQGGNNALRFSSASDNVTSFSNGTLRIAADAAIADGNFVPVIANFGTAFTANAGLTLGPKVVYSAGTGFLNVASAVPSVTLEAGSYWNLAEGAAVRNPQVNSLAGAGTVLAIGTATAGTAYTLTIRGNSGSVSDFSGSVINADTSTFATSTVGIVGVTKEGNTTQIFSGNNSYTGPTVINGGTLLINGNISTSSLTTVNTGGTLGGSGTAGATSVLGGTFAPGNSIGSIDIIGDLTLGPDSFSNFEISAADNISDLAIVSAQLNFGGTLNVSNIGGVLVLGQTYNLFDFASKSGTFSSVNLPTLSSGLDWNQDNLYTTGEISVIPEPGAALLGGLGLLVLLRRRR